VIVVKILCLCAAFTFGVRTGVSKLSININTAADCSPGSNNWFFDENEIEKKVEETIGDLQHNEESLQITARTKQRFTRKTAGFAVGVAKIQKNEFNSKFDYGLPDSLDKPEDTDVLLIYGHEKSLPNDELLKKASTHTSGGAIEDIPLLGANEATENCLTMNVIVTDYNSNDKKCLAISGNYESFHLQKWARQKEGVALNSARPLQHVGRGLVSNGREYFKLPTDSQITRHWKRLNVYLDSLSANEQKLGSILKRIAVNNFVVVMVCNLGQSILLQNFVCNARANNISLSNVIIFPTDKQTYDLAIGLGLAAFYDEENFKDMPTKEAAHYGDRTFAQMMYAKIVSVQLVNALGYDLLFQDVDVVWYQDPKSYFKNGSKYKQDFDVMFQDDGNRQARYSPYYANSGFYFVRSNDLTKYLFLSLLYSGDMVMAVGSHQQVLNALLIEHTSLYGLKVKTLSGEEFPGGWHYHRKSKKPLMKAIAAREANNVIFHMSWTDNKDNKQKFMEQMGMWYVTDQCLDEKALLLLYSLPSGKEAPLVNECCSAEAIVRCHYNDKPSLIPCNSSPSIDKYGQPFW